MATMWDFLVVVLCALCVCPYAVLAQQEIQFSFGKVRGVASTAQTTNKPFTAYYGIPFAEPPVGSRRFTRPEPFVGRDPNDIVSADTFRSACIQPIFFPGYEMSEDCLYINVFTPPGASAASPKKVMFWIYGGGFIFGDAYGYMPSRMVTDNDVIVVTFHYRLNIFGFLSSGRGDGNYGLYDMVAALQWTKDNIASFGGDPDDITIFGESAGSAAVSMLSLSPLTKGLFTKAIMQSGQATANWAMKKKPAGQFETVAKELDCLPFFYYGALRKLFHDDILTCLRSKSTDEIGQAALAAMGQQGVEVFLGVEGDQPPQLSDAAEAYANAFFLPVVDGDVMPRNADLLLKDVNYLRQNGVLDRAYVVGATNNEGLENLESFIARPGAEEAGDSVTLPESAEKFVRTVATTNKFTYFGIPSKVWPLLRYEYTFPRVDGKANLQNMLNMGSDTGFIIPNVEFVRAVASASPDTDIYVYLFDHFPQTLDPEGPIQGTSHAMDLLYEFDFTEGLASTYIYYTALTEQSVQPLADIFRGTLTQFAKTGNPGRGGSGNPSSWPRYSPDTEDYMALSLTPQAAQHMYAKRVALWTELIPDTMGRN